MPGSEPIQSVVRAAQIVQHVSQSPGGLGVGEIAARLGLKSPTTHHLLRTLVETGMLEKVVGPVRYRIGPMLRQIASWSPGRDLHPLAASVMRELSASMPGCNVILAEYINGEVTPTLRMSADQPGVVQQSGLHAMSAYTSASALMFQAHWPASTLALYRQRYPFGEFNTRWSSLDDLDAWLKDSRADGVVFCASQNDTHLAAAAAVCDGDGRLVATIGASMISKTVRSTKANRRMLMNQVKQAATQISDQLADNTESQPTQPVSMMR